MQWNIATTSRSDRIGCTLDVFQIMPNGKTRYASVHGKLFQDHDTALAYAADRGFKTKWYKRPWCFLGLKLPRATRRYIERTGHIDLIPQILGNTNERHAKWYLDHMYDSATSLYEHPGRRQMFTDAYRNRNKYRVVECRLAKLCETPCL